MFGPTQNDGSGSSQSLKKDTAKKDGKNPSIEWQFATNVKRYIDWKCNLCNESKSGGAPCIRDHFLGGNSRTCGGKCRGLGADEVATCLRAMLEKTQGSKKLQKSLAFQTPFLAQFRTTPNILENQPPSAMATTNASPESQAGSTKSRQVNLVDSFRTTALEEAQLALAQAIFCTGSSFTMVNHDEWKSAWKKIGEFGPGFTPSTYYLMQNQLLDKCYYNMQEDVKRLLLNVVNQSGCTIVSDGWSNVQ